MNYYMQISRSNGISRSGIASNRYLTCLKKASGLLMNIIG